MSACCCDWSEVSAGLRSLSEQRKLHMSTIKPPWAPGRQPCISLKTERPSSCSLLSPPIKLYCSPRMNKGHRWPNDHQIQRETHKNYSSRQKLIRKKRHQYFIEGYKLSPSKVHGTLSFAFCSVHASLQDLVVD